jgi:hypothetical protein
VRVVWLETGGKSRQEKTVAKPSRWNVEKLYEVVKEMLSQKEPIGQIARRHQVSEGLITGCGINSLKVAKRP